ncbi:hypothetical protein Y032_0551g3319, partial [Ancylostoma ceylanicum]
KVLSYRKLVNKDNPQECSHSRETTTMRKMLVSYHGWYNTARTYFAQSMRKCPVISKKGAAHRNGLLRSLCV